VLLERDPLRTRIVKFFVAVCGLVVSTDEVDVGGDRDEETKETGTEHASKRQELRGKDEPLRFAAIFEEIRRDVV